MVAEIAAENAAEKAAEKAAEAGEGGAGEGGAGEGGAGEAGGGGGGEAEVKAKAEKEAAGDPDTQLGPMAPAPAPVPAPAAAAGEIAALLTSLGLPEYAPAFENGGYYTRADVCATPLEDLVDEIPGLKKPHGRRILASAQQPAGATASTQPIGTAPPPAAPASGAAAPGFGLSNFKPAYDAARCPEYQDELLGAMRKIVVDYVSLHDIPQAAKTVFLEELQGEYGSLNESINSSAQKVWTSAQRLKGREFCSIYGEAIRNDHAALAEPCAVFARALNARLVTRDVSLADQTFPRGPGAGGRDKSTEANVSWRGGGFMDNAATRAFFVPGRKYRVAQFLATSFDLPVAQQFIGRVEHSPVVNASALWKVRLDPDRGCDHVSLVEEAHVPDESEFLFAAYSAFEVVTVHWSAAPQHPATPHELTIRAAADNANDPSFPEDLPLAPWC
jgi:hypothetical protein